MKQKWQISALFGTVFVVAWAITDTLAQYSCPPDNLCSQKSTYCQIRALAPMVVQQVRFTRTIPITAKLTPELARTPMNFL